MDRVLNKVFSQTNAVFLVLALKVVMQSENQNKNKRRSIKQAVLVQSPYVLLALTLHCDLVFFLTYCGLHIYTTGNS